LSVDINISNYEEFLLSYIDGELNNEERAAVEAFLQQHPAQAKELEVLKAAVLQPDETVGFGSREALYRSTVITTQNYETFLLSYIDGELNAAEQQALEAFLKKHPHLQQELDTWQATRLTASDTPQFEHKEMLYRHAGTLTLENYESYLLSYIDGELNEAEEQTLQAFLQQHPALQETLQLFRRTRLEADADLRMPDKAVLYRNRGGRNIQPVWWWGAAAAVVIGIMVWLQPALRLADNTAPIAGTGNKKPAADNAQQLQRNAAPKRSITKVPLETLQVQEAPALAANKPAAKPAQTQAEVKNTTSVQQKALQPASAKDQRPAGKNVNNNSSSNAIVLAQLPQPRATSEEVVQQHMEKAVQAATPPIQEVAANHAEQNPVMASTMKVQHTPEPEQPSAAPVQGELIMSVTSTGESRLLNGVASVAKFFSKKKRQKSE
jgi:anti-sigma factor RsiW